MAIKQQNTIDENGTAQANPRVGVGFAVTVAAFDAPQAIKNVSNFVCTGLNDQATINNAINSIAQPTGIVVLSAGNFNCNAPVHTRKGISLLGAGRQTRLIAKFGDGTGVIIHNGTTRDNVQVSNLAIFGEGRDIHGILWNTGDSGFDEGPWPDANPLSYIDIADVARSGVSISGDSNRDIIGKRVRVLA